MPRLRSPKRKGHSLGKERLWGVRGGEGGEVGSGVHSPRKGTRTVTLVLQDCRNTERRGNAREDGISGANHVMPKRSVPE